MYKYICMFYELTHVKNIFLKNGVPPNRLRLKWLFKDHFNFQQTSLKIQTVVLYNQSRLLDNVALEGVKKHLETISTPWKWIIT